MDHDEHIRPIHHRRARRGRGHVLLCMLAYYVTWHMQQALAPMLFTDHDKRAAALQRTSPVTTARVSPAARAKAATKRVSAPAKPSRKSAPMTPEPPRKAAMSAVRPTNYVAGHIRRRTEKHRWRG